MERTRMKYSCLFPTPFGHMSVVWSEHDGRPGILQVVLDGPALNAGCIAPGACPEVVESSCPAVDMIVDMIMEFLAGEDVAFPLDLVRLDLLNPFQQRVLRAEHAIPRGSVSTYGRIAAHLDVPGGARAVGTALATNPFPLVIPCHRAIRSDGALGGFQGGLAMKEALLRMEGVEVDARGHVKNARLHY
jgi:methylated-DNA-[protein]-cysteine S-methyltransferase